MAYKFHEEIILFRGMRPGEVTNANIATLMSITKRDRETVICAMGQVSVEAIEYTQRSSRTFDILCTGSFLRLDHIPPTPDWR